MFIVITLYLILLVTVISILVLVIKLYNNGGVNMSHKENKVVTKGKKVKLRRPGQPDYTLREKKENQEAQSVPVRQIRRQRVNPVRITPKIPKLR
jgi:hypothetical protein